MFQAFCKRVVFAAAFFLIGGSALAAQFTSGNLAVVRVGDGSAALTASTVPVFIDEYTPAGVLVQSIALPVAANAPSFALTLSGTASSEGEMHLSTDGKFLALAGYTAAPGAGAPSGSTSVAVPRTVGIIKFDGTFDTTTALTDFANLNNARGAFTTDGVNVWLAGADSTAGGVRYIGALGVTTSVNLTGTVKNARDVAVFNGQLYFASDKTAGIIETLGTGIPTSGSPVQTALPGTVLAPGSNSATNSFFFAKLGSGTLFNGFDTLYVADAGSATNATPGISKYSFNGTSWILNGTVGNTADAYEGLTGSVNTGIVTLYATKPGGIFSLVDSSGFNVAFAVTPSTVVSASTNTAFRGVAFAPKNPTGGHIIPVITGFAPDVSYAVSNASPTVAVAPNAAITSNAVNFNTGSLTISFSANGQAEDQLGILTANQITLNGTIVSYAGLPIGTVGASGIGGGPLVVTFTTTDATPAAVQALLRSISYHDTAAADVAALNARTVQAVVNDGAGLSNSQSAPVTLNINVANLNNKPPVLTVPGAQTTPKNVLATIHGISVADPDAATNPLVLTLGAAHGTLSIQSPVSGGVTVANTQGNFSKSITLSGPLSALNATLGGGLTYLPDTDFVGSDAVSLNVNDLGNTGPGGFRTDVKSIAITVSAVATAPVPVADTATVNRNSTGNVIDVLANDTNTSGTALTITEITQPAHGTASIVDGKVLYTPAAGFAGTDTFTYSMSDANLPGAQVVDITTPQTFVPLTLDNGLQYIDNGGDHVVVHDGSFGSAVCPVPGVPNEFYMITDRGLALPVAGGEIFPIAAYQPSILHVRVNADGSSSMVGRIFLKNEGGQPLNSLPNADNLTGEVPLDIFGNPIDISNNRDGFRDEGLAALSDGTFWISDEYGPFLTHFDASGTIIERLKPLPGAGHKLPNVLINRDPGRALEGLCVTPDGTKLVACMQTALLNNGTTTTPDLRGPNDNNAKATAALRIIVYTIASGTVQEFIYLLEDPALKTSASDISALSNTDFLVIERDGKFPNEPSLRKRLWHISLTGATDVHDPVDSTTGLLYTTGTLGATATGQTIEQLTFNKTRADAITALKGVGVFPVTIGTTADYDLLKFPNFNHDKTEGLAILNGGKTIVVSNDDDNGVDQGTDALGKPIFITKYKPGTRTIDASQLLIINPFQTVTVNVINHAPVADAQDLDAPKGAPVNGTLSGSDADGDALTFHVVTNPAHGTLISVDASTGAFQYAPTGTYTGLDAFTFTVNDGLLDSAEATVTIDIVNNAPVAGSQSLAVPENTTVTGTLIGADADGDALTFSIVNAGAHGTAVVTGASAGTFMYTPTADFVGNDTVTFKVNDGTADSNVGTVTITVNAAPAFTSTLTATPPVANVGDTVLFTGAADQSATLSWNFGDGSTGTGASVTHVYEAAGVYTVTLSASANNQTVTQTQLYTVNEFGSGLTQAKLALSKATIVLNFATPETNVDSISLLGKIAIPANFNPAGQHVLINVGGVVKAFDLNASGSSPNGEFRVTIKTTKGVVKKQTAPFTLTLTNGNFKTDFSGEGFTAAETKVKHVVDVEIVLGNTASEALKSLSFTKIGNVGTAK